MNQRERLINLLYDVGRDYDDFVESCHDDGLSVTESFEEFAADLLLKKGVRVLTWDGAQFGVLVDGDVIPIGDQYACLRREEAESESFSSL